MVLDFVNAQIPIRLAEMRVNFGQPPISRNLGDSKGFETFIIFLVEKTTSDIWFAVFTNILGLLHQF